MDSVLSATERRAEDLRRTLASFDPARATSFAQVLLHFESCSQQLGLLLERGTDASADALLERHFAVPSAIAGLGTTAIGGVSAGLVPHLLSTALDKEQEDDYLTLSELVGGHAAAASSGVDCSRQRIPDAMTAHHNECLDKAHAHLMQCALSTDLPGAANLQGAQRRFGRETNQAEPAAAAAGVAEATSQRSAQALLNALRKGDGLPPPPMPSASAATDDPDDGINGANAPKRPRTGA